MTRYRFELPPDQSPGRVDKVLARLLPDVSRSAVQRWILDGLVLINGCPCRARDSVGPGRVLEVTPGPSPPTLATGDPEVAVNVLYEDPHLIVVNKPAGLVVHPARGHWQKTLVNGLLARPGFLAVEADPGAREGGLRPGIVHRLDKDTSGVLVVAKDDTTREGLKRQLAAHTMERVYWAVTQGVPRAGRLVTCYGRHPRARVKYTSRLPCGRQAITQVGVLRALAGARLALVELRLETGRTHQIRVHLSEQLRAPVFADPLYGSLPTDPDLRQIALALGRQALHAGVLGFEHPVSRQMMRFEAPLPVDIEQAIDALERLP